MVDQNKPVNISEALRQFTNQITNKVIEEARKSNSLPLEVILRQSRRVYFGKNLPSGDFRSEWNGEGLDCHLCFDYANPDCSPECANGEVSVVNASFGTGEDGLSDFNRMTEHSRKTTYYLVPSTQLVSYWNLALIHKGEFGDENLSKFFANINRYLEIANEILLREYPHPIGWNISDSIFRYCFKRGISPRWFEWKMESEGVGQTFLEYLEAQGDTSSLRLAKIYNTAEYVREYLDADERGIGVQNFNVDLRDVIETTARNSAHTEALRWELQFGEATLARFSATLQAQGAVNSDTAKKKRSEQNELRDQKIRELANIVINLAPNTRRTNQSLASEILSELCKTPSSDSENLLAGNNKSEKMRTDTLARHIGRLEILK